MALNLAIKTVKSIVKQFVLVIILQIQFHELFIDLALSTKALTLCRHCTVVRHAPLIILKFAMHRGGGTDFGLVRQVQRNV